jgi:hypothetical protein
MRMEPVDVEGSLFSEAGLRFGGFQTSDFFRLTEPLEDRNPGIRTRIVAEAHHLVFWLHRFPEIAFLFGIVLYKSVLLGLSFFVFAFVFEVLRFYIWGHSPWVSSLSRLWNWLRVPSYLAAAFFIGLGTTSLIISLFAFLILQGWLGLFSTVAMLPFRMFVASFVYKKFGGNLHNIEGLALVDVTNYWRLRLFPADRFKLNDGKSQVP